MHVRSLGFGALPPEYTDLKARFLALRAQVRTPMSARDKLSMLTALVNVIGQLAKFAPTPDLAARWMGQYRTLFATLGSLRSQVTDNPPSSFMLQLDKFSDGAIAIGSEALNLLDKGASGIVSTLPLVLLGLLGVAGLVGYGYVKHGGVRVS